MPLQKCHNFAIKMSLICPFFLVCYCLLPFVNTVRYKWQVQVRCIRAHWSTKMIHLNSAIVKPWFMVNSMSHPRLILMVSSLVIVTHRPAIHSLHSSRSHLTFATAHTRRAKSQFLAETSPCCLGRQNEQIQGAKATTDHAELGRRRTGRDKAVPETQLH